MTTTKTMTNYDVLTDLARDGKVFYHKWEGKYRERRYIGITALEVEPGEEIEWECKKLEVVESFEYDGDTHEWAFAEGQEVSVHEYAHPKESDYICLYETSRVYGGAAEGGWFWSASHLVAVVMLRTGGPTDTDQWHERAFLEDMAKEMELESYDSGYYIVKERIPGYHQTVGSKYYC